MTLVLAGMTALITRLVRRREAFRIQLAAEVAAAAAERARLATAREAQRLRRAAAAAAAAEAAAVAAAIEAAEAAEAAAAAAAAEYVRLLAARAALLVRLTADLERAQAALASLSARADGEYMASSHLAQWQATCGYVATFYRDADRRLLASPLWQRLDSLNETLQAPKSWVSAHNSKFVSARAKAIKAAGDNGGGMRLSPRQQIAVIRNENANLVVAGAGAGKTATMIERVQYLLRWRLAHAEEILVVCFGKKAANELRERLLAFDVENVDVMTTHALGLHILGQVEGSKPPVSALGSDDITAGAFVDDQLRQLWCSSRKNAAITAWYTEQLYAEDPIRDCKDGAQYYARIREMGLRSLDGQMLTSLQEVKIANWLTLNGYDWEYEASYRREPKLPTRQRYTPDFLIRSGDQELWIEHFGIDADGRTAKWVDQQRYTADMEWKRDTHKRCGTTLVESYSYQDWHGTLLSGLRASLTQHGFPPRPLAKAQLQKLLAEPPVERAISDLSRLLLTFIRLFKGSLSDRKDLEKKRKSDRERVFLDLFDLVHKAYEARLRQEAKIDFDDMLAGALRYCRDGSFRGGWRHILVDEFQDTSGLRLAMLTALRDQHIHGHLFCVGDDWQSVFRFAGADATLFKNLSRHAGCTVRTNLDRTYRCSQPLVDLSSHFVTRNARQLTKEVTSHAQTRPHAPHSPVLVCFHAGERGAGLSQDQAIDLCLRDIVGHMAGQPADVLFLGRYNWEKPTDIGRLSATWRGSGLTLMTLTAHRAKGLEVDFVVVLGNKSGRHGFPSGITDDPVLRLVLAQEDDHPNAEERRLFYVALTRARRRVYLLADEEHPSSFVQELCEYGQSFAVEQTGDVSERFRCPLCHGKTILRRSGKYGDFWACMNWPGCSGRLRTCVSCDEVPREPVLTGERIVAYRCGGCGEKGDVCPRCETGELVPKSGRYGDFRGCSNWAPEEMGCGFTQKDRGQS